MLLNASHEITCAGLPAHIQDRYVRYKQGNRAIVAWMTRYGPEKYKGRKTLPIKQLISLGKLLCDKVDEIGTLPSDVDYYFKEVIKERAYLSQHFRTHRDQCEKDIIDTINHEHFTDSLKQIHTILLTAGKPKNKGRPKAQAPHKSRSRSSMSSVAEVRNTFSQLLSNINPNESDRESSDDGISSDAETDATSECSHESPLHSTYSCEENEDSVDFLDASGEVGTAVEVTMFLERIDSIVKAVESCWAKAGRAEMPVAAAAAYTNILLSRISQHVQSLQQTEEQSQTVSDLSQSISVVSCGSQHHDGQHVSHAVQLLEELEKIDMLLGQILSEVSDNHVLPAHGHIDKSTSAAEDSLMINLLRDIIKTLSMPPPSEITKDGLVGVNDFRPVLRDPSSNHLSLNAVIYLHVVATSHVAYSSTSEQPSRIAMPRISALKMANEAVGSINGFLDDKSIFPCQCTNTLGYRVAQMKRELEAFAKFRCWNSLMQSPLIAGTHVLEIHDLCSFYGMHLFHYRQYVAAVLHSYQALRQLQYLEAVPVLEEICSLFVTVLYTTGVRPEAGFMASWYRYIGARLKFKTGKKHQNHRDTWCMSVPAHAAARSAGLDIGGKRDEIKVQPKFDFGTIDSIIKFKHNSWNLPVEQVDALDRSLQRAMLVTHDLSGSSNPTEQALSLPTPKKQSTRHKRTKSCSVKQTERAASEECTKLDHELMASFTPDSTGGRNCPASRVNLLSLFHSMTKVVAGISDSTHAEEDKSSSRNGNSGKGQMCLCFVQTILRGADRVLDARRRGGFDAKGAVWTKNEKECIECYKQHLMLMLEDAKVDDCCGGAWLWTSM